MLSWFWDEYEGGLCIVGGFTVCGREMWLFCLFVFVVWCVPME